VEVRFSPASSVGRTQGISRFQQTRPASSHGVSLGQPADAFVRVARTSAPAVAERAMVAQAPVLEYRAGSFVLQAAKAFMQQRLL
jgi:hypothetical protein